MLTPELEPHVPTLVEEQRAEIDRLRAENEALREAGEGLWAELEELRRWGRTISEALDGKPSHEWSDYPTVATRRIRRILAEIDRLRAENEALREAGEGLAATVRGRWMPDAPPAAEALARWREVAGSGDADDIGPPAPGEGDDYGHPELNMKC